MSNNSYNKQFATLSNNLDLFVHEVKKKKLTLMATDKWTVKEVLCHLVFWHENYAANYKALSEKKEPPLLDGPLYKFNIEGVKSLEKEPVEKLIERLKNANKSLEESIIEKKVPQMTYKKNGRVFKTEDFLKLVARHFLTHQKQVKRAI